MTKLIGQHFAAELEAAGLGGLPISWTHDGTLVPGDELTPAQLATLQQVYDAHDADYVDLVDFAADLRWRREVGGITVAGIPVATDDRAKMMIIGARVAAQVVPGWSTVWHGTDGNSYPLDAAAMIAISDAVQAHVNAGFATFAAVKEQIAAGTITTVEQVEAAFGS